MPIYEFRCSSCDTDFEELVLRLDDQSLAGVACRKCGSRQVVKKISRFAAGAGSASTSRGAASACAPSG